MDGVHDLPGRVAVEELDHSTLAGELGDPVERWRQGHQEVRSARALGRLEMVSPDHAKPSRLRHRGGKLGRPHLAHGGKLNRQVTANKPGESAADGHGRPSYVIAAQCRNLRRWNQLRARTRSRLSRLVQISRLQPYSTPTNCLLGRNDSNLQPSHPESSALTVRHSPKLP